MNISKFTVPKGTQYLSDVISSLPKNCLFNKGAVGAGGTTIALTDKRNTVIAVPFRELIVNKVEQVQTNKSKLYNYDVFGLYGGISTKSLLQYLDQDGYKKIMVTYDSLPKLLSHIDPSDYDILIDEMHILFTQYSFRSKAAKGILRNFNKFNNFTFMTATPIEDEFLLEELKSIPVVEAVWEDVKEVTIIPVRCKNGVKKSTIGLVEQFINGTSEGNLYLFVNSVKFIKDIVNSTKLSNKNCRVIYSDNNTTELPIKRGKTTDQPKKINFITSTAFEGADIYDPNGKIVVVSDINSPHTLLDISTQLIQITGRIRDTKYNSVIYHLHTGGRYLGDKKLSFDEFKQLSDETLVLDSRRVERNKEDRDFLIKSIERSTIIYYGYDEEEDTYYLDNNRIKIDLYNYKITNEVYKNKINITNEYKNNGFKVGSWDYDSTNVEIVNLDDLDDDFESVIKQLKENDGTEYGFWLMAGAMFKYPYIYDAIKELGYDKIEQMNFRTNNIKRKLDTEKIKKSNDKDIVKVARYINKESIFKIGDIIPLSEAKSKLQFIYDTLSIKATAKATDMENYFITGKISKRIDREKVKCIALLQNKINIHH